MKHVAAQRRGQGLDTKGPHCSNPIAADHHRRMKPPHLVDHASLQECRCQPWSGFDHDRGDAARWQQTTEFNEIKVVDGDTVDACHRFWRGGRFMHEQGAGRIKDASRERELGPAVKHDTAGVPNRHAVSAMVITDGERWIVSEHCAPADDDGIDGIAQGMHNATADRSGDEAGSPGPGRDPPVEAGGRLQHHEGPVANHGHGKRSNEGTAGIGDGALGHDDVDAGMSQRGHAATTDPRIWIFGANDDASDALGNESLGARWRAARVGAGLESDDGGQAARRPRPSFAHQRIEGIDLSVGATRRLVVADGDNGAVVVDDDATHGWVGARTTHGLAGFTEGAPQRLIPS